MSFGDEIMASGHALARHRQTGRIISIEGKDGKRRWSDLWRGLHWIADQHCPSNEVVTIRNGPGCRPYIAYPFTRALGQRYTGWRARDHKGVLHLFEEEVEFAQRIRHRFGPYVLVEPHVPSNPNKQWGYQNWEALCEELRGVTLIQVGQAIIKGLPGVHWVQTPSFRHGAAILAHADYSVLPEGGLHHAAGVLDKKVAVLFGGSPSVEVTGYEHHDNLVSDVEGTPCGKWTSCPHCVETWNRLKPEMVAERVRQYLCTLE